MAADHALDPVLSRDDREPRTRGLWVSSGASLAAFLVLAVLASRQPYFPLDVTIAHAVQGVHVAWFTLLLRPFNQLGFPPVVDIIYAAVILVVFVRGARWAAISCAFASVGTAGLNFLTKALVTRPRPPDELVSVEHHIPNSSFPAGHVLNFTAFAGFFLYLSWVRMEPSWRRTALIAVLAAMIVVMGVARIDSGEHWASDVLGGYLLGAAWLGATVRFYGWGRHRARRLGHPDKVSAEDPPQAP